MFLRVLKDTEQIKKYMKGGVVRGRGNVYHLEKHIDAAEKI
jgi:hypothetical protein